MPYLLYVGFVVEEALMLGRAAVSPAANRWQSGLLQGLRADDADVEVVGYLPERVWPRGALVAPREALAGPALGGRTVRYLNFPFLRQPAAFVSLERAVREVIRRRGPPSAILTYNASTPYALLGLYEQRRHGVPWVPIVADVPATEAEWRWHDALVARAAGRVFLSWFSYEQCLHEPKFHLDGGVELPLPPNSEPSSKTLLFAGALNRWGGATELVEAFRHVRDADAQLWVCGKGPTEALVSRAAGDPRIKVLGAVSEAELDRLMSTASAFVNPRATHLAENQHNFPSKLLHYLRYGKPIISTWTAGISPEFRDVLVVPEGDAPTALAAAMEQVLAWDRAERERRGVALREFVLKTRRWDLLARRLREWLDRDVGPSKRRG